MLKFGVRHGEHVWIVGGVNHRLYISGPKTNTPQESISETHRNQPKGVVAAKKLFSSRLFLPLINSCFWFP